MISKKQLVGFITGAVVSTALVYTSISYAAAVKWRRMSSSLCKTDSVNHNTGRAVWDGNWATGGSGFAACPWVSSETFDFSEVTLVQVDLVNGNVVVPTAQLCVSFAGSMSGSCSSTASNSTKGGYAQIAISDSTRLAVWHNNGAQYPYVLVNMKDNSNALLGYKVIK